MLSYIFKKWFKHRFGTQYALEDDPFLEEYTLEKKSFLSGSAKMVKSKRARTIPQHIPTEYHADIRRLRGKAHKMELMFKFFGARFGWVNILEFIPVIGDCLSLYFSFMLVNDARKTLEYFPPELQAQCLFNVAFTFLIGLIPIVGDVIGVAYKPNCRNVLLIEDFLDQKYLQKAKVL